MVAVIELDNVGKRYRLGQRAAYGRLTESLDRWFRAPWSRSGSTAAALDRHVATQPATNRDVPADEFWALRDVSLSISEGEVVGLIGRNGAGKSTLLKLLSRIATPTRGRVGVRGRLGCLLEVGTGFHPELTGRENVFLNGAILGMSRREIRDKFEAIVAFAEVERFLDTQVKHYSSGMFVRLAFAVAALLEPDVLIVDEVLSVGDQAFQKKCLDTMQQAAASGRTCLIVSHNLPSIVNLCSRAILLEQGRVAADGPVRPIVQEYLAGASAGGQRSWTAQDAPGNANFRIRRVEVLQCDAAGNEWPPSASVDLSRETIVRFTYESQQPGATYYCGLWLSDLHGTKILATMNAPSLTHTPDPWFGRELPAGIYQTDCIIPANFLNETRYFLSLFVGHEVGVPVVSLPNVLAIDGHDTGAMSLEYRGSWAGPILRPRMSWRTRPLESSDAESVAPPE